MVHSLTYLVLWLNAWRFVAAVKHGTIGYGINMFHPWCCYACYDALATVYLSCTDFSLSDEHGGMDMKLLKKRMDMGMDQSGTTSEDCYASNKPYQQSLSYCIKSHCDAEGKTYKKQNHCFQSLNSIGIAGPSLQQSLPPTAPSEEMEEDAEWLNITMLVNEAYWKADRGTIEEFERGEEDHVAYSIAIMVVSVGVPLLCGGWQFLSSRFLSARRGLMFQLQSYIILPALWSKRHSQPLPWRIGYVPSRVMTIWIAIYIALNVIASSVPFRSVQPNTWFSSRTQEMIAYVGNRAGVLSFANMALSILFAGRNNPLLYFSGWDQTTQIVFHRWAARVAIVQAVIHSIVYTADYCYLMGENMYYSEAAKPYFWWGIIATISMGLMMGLSALPLRAYAYETFLVAHIILAIISLLGSWYHVDFRYSKKWGYEVWLYIAFAFWAFDRLIRLWRVLYYTIFQRPVASVEIVPGTNVAMMTIFLKKPSKAGISQHTYVYFPSAGKFWESHPFTICDWDDRTVERSTEASSSDLESSEGSIGGHEAKNDARITATQIQPTASGNGAYYVRCLFRAHAGMTAQLHRQLLSNSPLQVPVAIEGFYGGHSSSHWVLNKADVVLCIAGGVGITYASGIARQFSRERLLPSTSRAKRVMGRCQKFVLASSIREEALLEHVKEHLLPDLGTGAGDDGSMVYRFWLTGQQAASDVAPLTEKSVNSKAPAAEGDSSELVQQHRGRMNVADVVGSVMVWKKRIVVLVCGPGSLSDDVRMEVTNCSRAGYTVDLIEESFSW